jgi:hypothetical protein
MKMSSGAVLINVALFQIGWFTCVWSAAVNQPWIGVLVVVGVVAVHLWRSPVPQREAQLIVLALGIGSVFDSALVWQGWLKYSSGILAPQLAPTWIIALWGLFATVLNVSLRWMRGRWAAAALFGAFGGPAAYYGGLRLGALEFGDLSAGLTALAIGWAALTPLLLALSARYDGHAAQPGTVTV